MTKMGDLNAYTELGENICLHILAAIQRECGEIGNVQIENNDISFEVYRGYYEDTPKVIRNRRFILRLIDKFDDPFFTLVYKIHMTPKHREL
jgi:hypothetical protein